MNPAPVTVRVRPVVPIRVEAGLRLERVGTGLPFACVQEPAAETVVARPRAFCAWTVAV